GFLPLGPGGWVLTMTKLPSPPASGLLHRYTLRMFRLLGIVLPNVPVESKATNFPLALIDALRLGAAPAPSVTRLVWPVWRSRTNTSITPLLSAPPGSRLLAADWSTTKRPSALMPGLKLPALAWPPSPATLTRSVCPVARSRTKTSVTPLVSPATRFDESDSKAAMLPSPDSAGGAAGAAAKPDASPPAAGTLTRVTLEGPDALPASARKTSVEPLKSSPTRLSAADSKTPQRPS